MDRARRSRPALRAERHVRARLTREKTYNDGNIRRDSVSLALQANLTRDLSVTFGALPGPPHDGPDAVDLHRQLPGRRAARDDQRRHDEPRRQDQYLNTNLQLYTAGLQYQLAPDWQLDVAYSYSKATRRRNESTLYLQDAADNYTDSRYVGMEDHRFSQWRAMVEGKVRTAVQPPDRARRVVAEAGE